MKIAILSMAKPVTGTGIGTTEYTHQLVMRLKEYGKDSVDTYYALPSVKRNDIGGMIYINTLFKQRLGKLARMDYDIIHITIQELGFAAKILKKMGSRAKIVMTVHDLIRLKKELHRGILQPSYNRLVKWSIEDGLKYADCVTFNSTQTRDEVIERFGAPKMYRVIWHGTQRPFFSIPLPKKKSRTGKFIVGYIGALGQHKNVISLARAAELLKDRRDIEFHIFGSGVEENNINAYITDNKLGNVMMKGFVREEDIVSTYDGFDAFVMPSLYEGLSHQILEAGARGIPVVVFENARIPKEVTKRCLKANGVQGLAEVLRSLADKGFSAKERKAEISYYSAFTWDRTAIGMRALYAELVRGKRAIR